MACMQVSVRTAVSYGVGSAKVAGRGALDANVVLARTLRGRVTCHYADHT